MDKLFDFDHPFFRPLWIRLAVVVLCLGWAAFELLSGSPGWAMLFGGIGIYAAYRLLVTFNPREKP